MSMIRAHGHLKMQPAALPHSCGPLFVPALNYCLLKMISHDYSLLMIFKLNPNEPTLHANPQRGIIIS